jgi:protein TonB
MFEQTFLTSSRQGRKIGALVASFVAQICLLSVLLLGPLLYTRAMPLVIPKLGLPVFVNNLPAPEPPREQPRSQPTSSVAPTAPRIFHPIVPTRVPTGPIPTTIVEEVPALVGDAIAPGTQGIGRVENSSLPVYIAAIPRPETVVVTPPAPPAKPTPVSSGVLASKLVTRVVPQYPDIARRARISGVVRLLAVIGKDGHVQSLRVIDGHPFLREAALNAVKQWVYTPTYVGDRAIEVESSVEVNFILN